MKILNLYIYQFIFLVIATLISYIIKGITGFGNTVIMVPFFSFILTSKQITPIDLLFSIPINAFLFIRDKKSFSLKIVIPLAIMLLIGDVIGAMFLQNTDDRILKLILSLFIIIIGIEILTRPK